MERGVAQRPEPAAGDDVEQGEGVAAEHVDVLEAERGEAGHVLVACASPETLMFPGISRGRLTEGSPA